MVLAHRSWVPEQSETRVQSIAMTTAKTSASDLLDQLQHLTEMNLTIHERDCFNLNPATNVMNPKAEALLSQRLGSRPSLGYPGDKYEMGLEAIEEIEVIAAQLVAEVFGADFAEIRVASGAMANLYSFMATCDPGDTIITPPASVGGHVTHHAAGCAGLYGLRSVSAPVDEDGYSIDLQGLADLVHREKPKLITVGGSLNLFEHPTRAIRDLADNVGAKVLFDAAHQCGLIAGKAWTNPLSEGAHLVTMSTYKSLGGPAGGVVVTNEPDLAERLDRIAFPGMTANFDAGKSAALAVTMLDWREHGVAYAQAMIELAQALSSALAQRGLPVFQTSAGFTRSHQFAVEAAQYGGGQTASKALRDAGFLACGIGLPRPEVKGDLNGLRIGTPELVRWGVTPADVPRLADLIAEGLSESPRDVAARTKEFRAEFSKLHYIV